MTYAYRVNALNAAGRSDYSNVASVTTPAPVYALDTFGRDITDGWGSAVEGGTYTLTGSPANFDVDGSTGLIVVPQPNYVRTAVLADVSARDVDIIVTVSTDKRAGGGSQETYVVARRTGTNTEYRLGIQLRPDGTVTAVVFRVTSGTAQRLGQAVIVPGLTHQAAVPLRIRALVSGASPTTLSVKVWQDGQPEPSNWTLTRSDATASLQGAGAVGLRTFVAKASTVGPVRFRLDDFRVAPIVAP